MYLILGIVMVVGSALLFHTVRFREGKKQPRFVHNEALAGLTVIAIISLFAGGVGLTAYTLAT